MRIGVNFPYHAIGADVALSRAYAQRAEELGFSHLVLLDHVLGPEHDRRDPPLEGPYTEETLFREPLILISWLGAQTTTLGFMCGVLVLPQRQTALVAKQAAELQILLEGRFRLGVGSGWNYVEYESLGVPYARRGVRLDDQLDVLRALWSGSVVDLTTEFHRIDRASMLPAPPPIPIWFGGYSGAQQRRCAERGDGFLFARYSSLSRQGAVKMAEMAVAAGRPAGALGFETALDADERLLESIEEWAGCGGTHVYVRVPGEGWTVMDELERLADRLGSALRSSN